MATEINGTWIVTDPNGAVGSGGMMDVTLPYAVAHALSSPVADTIGDTISFASSLSGDTITLNGTLTMTQDVTIQGLGAANLFVSGNSAVEVFNVTSAVTDASISGLTVEDGEVTNANGGGIANAGTLTLSNITITANTATQESGGGIYNASGGTLTLTNTTLSGNKATLGDGGGLANAGSATVSNSIFTGNVAAADSGGGINNATGGTLTLSNSTITNNSAAKVGGGVRSNATTTLTYDTISGNSSTGNGGGIDVTAGTTTLTDCTVFGNSSAVDGGGICLGAGTATLYDDTISGNTGTGGGGGINITSGTMTLTDSTVFGNSTGASKYGGGIQLTGGTATLYNDTVSANSAGNDGGGIALNAASVGSIKVTLNNTIVAGNSAPTDPDIYKGPGLSVTVTANYSLIGNNASSGITATSGNIVNPTYLGLSALGNYGGPIQTVALLSGSPALGAGSTTLDNGQSTDQRGQPRTVNGLVDMGAFETQPAPLVVTTAADPGLIPGQLSLREAINLASTGAAGTSPTITFASSLSGDTITLTSTLTLTSNVTITGLGATSLAISGNNTFEVFKVAAPNIAPVVTATIANLTIENGKASEGGGIYNSGTLTLSNVTITGNSAVSGAGIYDVTGGMLTLSNATISNNTAQKKGGGIYWPSGGTLSLTNSTLSANSAASGGGVYIAGGSASLSNDIVSSNTATSMGGGIYSAGTATLSNDTLSSNVVTGSTGVAIPVGEGGGLYSSGTLVLTNAALTGNSAVTGGGVYIAGGTVTLSTDLLSSNTATNKGGGIYNAGLSTLGSSSISSNAANGTGTNQGFGGGIYNTATFTVANSTLANNAATSEGGGIYTNNGQVAVSNSTLYGNSTTGTTNGEGGGVYAAGTVTLADDTISQNSANVGGGGIYVSATSIKTVLVNSLVAGNTSTQNADISVGTANGSLSFASDDLIGAAAGTGYTLPSSHPGVLTGQSYTPTSLLNNGAPTEIVGALGQGQTETVQTVAVGSASPAAIHAGGAVTTLSTAVTTASMTTITLKAFSITAGSFSSTYLPDPFGVGEYLLIGQEEMLITSITNNTNTYVLTVVRGALGTTAASSYASGVSVYMGADARDAIRSSTQDIGAYQTETFGVYKATPTPSGIQLVFNEPINAKSTVLYSSPGDTTLGPTDFTVVGATTGAVRGSLIIDPTNPDIATFVATAGLLPPDTYTVTVTSAVTAASGDVARVSYTTTFTVTTPTTPVLSVPSFARGPGQSVVLPDSLGNATGIPISIANATGVTAASFTLTYDPLLLTIPGTGALSLSARQRSGGSGDHELHHHTCRRVPQRSDGTLQPGRRVRLDDNHGSAAGDDPGQRADNSAYLDKALLNLSNVVVNTAAALGVSGVDENAYIGDVLGTGVPNATDASLVDQVASGSGTGFSVFKDLDPVIIGGVGGGLLLNANDASLIDEAASGATVSQIPSIPVGVSLAFGGPDPYLYLSAVQGSPGQTVTETLYLDVTNPNGIQLTALDEAIGFDASALQISDVRGTGALAALGSYDTANTVDNGSGEFLVAQAFMGTGLPPVVPYGTDIPVLQFNVTLNADMGVGSQTGLTLLQYGTVNNETQYTAISDNEGALTWTPGKAPSNSGNAAIDGTVTVVPATIPVTSVPAAVESQTAVVVPPRVIEPVRRVTPVSSIQVGQSAASTGTSVSLVLAGGTGATPVVELVLTNVSPLPSLAASVQPEANPMSAASTVATEVVPLANGAPSITKVADPGAALSLAALSTNKVSSVALPESSSVKSSTSMLDEMYRQLGTVLAVPSGYGYNLGASGGESSGELDNVWDIDELLADQTKAD